MALVMINTWKRKSTSRCCWWQGPARDVDKEGPYRGWEWSANGDSSSGSDWSSSDGASHTSSHDSGGGFDGGHSHH
ncbi:MAG: hypothetical protein JNM17_37150 [Archangium sp.]|nr:hypothetical protein [Archangium sp.]